MSRSKAVGGPPRQIRAASTPRADGERLSLAKPPIPRCREKLLSIAHADRTQTDTGGRVENTKAHG